jgi:hypothetical protein
LTAGAAQPSLVLASVSTVHQGWAWVVIVGNGLAGLWALGAARWPALRVRQLWWFTALAELAAFVQVGLGVWLLSVEDRTVPDFHVFYGFLCIIAVAIIYSYRHQMHHRLYLLYGFGGLFIMGLAIRALVIE